MHHPFLTLDQQVPAMRELEAGWLNDGRCASADTVERCAGALSRGNGAHSLIPLVRRHDVDGVERASVTYVHRSYSSSGVLVSAADHCQN